MILTDLLEDKLIFEDHARKLYFDYTKIHRGMEETTKPVVLYLGTWHRRLNSGVYRNYWCGIDLNNLDEEQLAALQYHLPEILKNSRIYNRYHTGKELLPDVFVPFYRTYNTNNVGAVIKGRLFSLDVTDADKEEAIEINRKNGGREWDELSKRNRSYFIAQAVRERGTREAEKQEKAAKAKDEAPEKKEKPPKKMPKPLPKEFVPIKPAIPTSKVPPTQPPRPEQVPPSTQATKHSIIQPSPQRLRPGKPPPIEKGDEE